MRQHQLLAPAGVHSVPVSLGHHGFLHFHLTVPATLARQLATGGPLESWGLSLGLLVAAAAAVVGWWLVRRHGPVPRRRRRVWTGRGLVGGSLVLALLGVAVGVNAYAGYVPTVGAAAALLTGTAAAPSLTANPVTRPFLTSTANLPPAGQPGAVATSSTKSSVVNLPLPAPTLGMPNGNAYVYLPPGFSTSHRYPVLYLLGGAPGAPTDWIYAGGLQGTLDTLIRRHYVRPFIVVMPRLSPQWHVDYEGLNAVRGPQVMTYLVHVVVPAIDARFPTVAGRAGRAIAGFSAGADASLNTAFHNQATFSVAGAIEPQGQPGSKANWVLANNPQLIAQNSPILYLPTIPMTQPLAVYLSAGSHRTQGAVPTLARELTARGQTVLVHDENGLGHTWVDARNDLPYLLQFVSQAFRAA